MRVKKVWVAAAALPGMRFLFLPVILIEMLMGMGMLFLQSSGRVESLMLMLKMDLQGPDCILGANGRILFFTEGKSHCLLGKAILQDAMR